MDFEKRGRVGDSGVEELSSDKPKKKKDRNSGGGNGGKGKVILVIVLIIFIGYMWKESVSGGIGLSGMKNMFSGFNSTPEENLNVYFNEVKDIEKIGKEGFKGSHKVYDKKNIYEDDKAFLMVEKEYALYVYTGDEKLDSRFNEWAMREQKKYPIYKLDRSNMYSNEELISYTTSNRVPMVYIIKEVDKNHKVVDQVVTNPDMLDDMIVRLDELKEARMNKKKGKE